MEYLISEQLVLKIYTVGYKSMGESIIFLIIVDGNIKFSGVVDCYETENLNKTLEILKENKIQTLDFICMTHPDKDHCRGLEKILNMTQETTKIVYPINLFYNGEEYDKYVNTAVTAIAQFVKMNTNNSNKPQLISCVGKKIIPIEKSFKDVNTGYVYPVEIKTYSPITDVLEKRPSKLFIKGIRELEKIEHNDLSIMLSVAVGDFKMLLCGDIENDSIQLLKKEFTKEDMLFFSKTIDYYKIPHHGSNGSNEMKKMLSTVSELSNSITTVYANKHLPDSDMINYYKSKSEKIYCTSNIKNENKYEYGIVELTIDLLNGTIKEEKKANAIEL